jgi:hypothetical protein
VCAFTAGGASVFSTVSTCNSDVGAIRVMRSAAGSSFAVRLELDPSQVQQFHWISPYVLMVSHVDGSVLSVTWEAPLVRGSPPTPGESAPPTVQALSESGRLGAFWSSLRGKTGSCAIAFAAIPPHDAQ